MYCSTSQGMLVHRLPFVNFLEETPTQVFKLDASTSSLAQILSFPICYNGTMPVNMVICPFW